MKQFLLFLIGIISSLIDLFFVSVLRFILEPDYIVRYNPGYVVRNNLANKEND